jgi:hypothetical protein
MKTMLPLLFGLLLVGCARGDQDHYDEDSYASGRKPAEPVTGASALGCGFAASEGAQETLMAWSLDDQLVLVRADGTSFTAHTFDATPIPEGGAPATIFSTTAGDFIAAGAMRYIDSKEVWEAVLLTRKGEVLWKGAEPDHQYFPEYLGESGLLAFRLYAQQSTLVVAPDGTSKVFPGTEPLAAPTPEGTLIVRAFKSADDPGEIKLLLLSTGALSDPPAAPSPQAYPLFAGSAAISIDGGLVYIGDDSGSPLVVREKGADVATILSPTAKPALEAASPIGLALLREGDPQWAAPRWLADAGAGAVTPVPALGSLFPFGYGFYDEGPSLASDGRAVAVLRDEHKGGLFSIDAKSSAWSPIGGTFRDVWDIHVKERGGTFVLTGRDAPGYFPMDPWKAGMGSDAADFAGPAVQVARPSEGAFWELPKSARSIALRKDGMCVAFVADGRLSAMDLSKERTFELVDGGPAMGGTPIWVGTP